MPVSKPTARRMFDRVAQDASAIERPALVSYLKGLGLGSGLLGGQKVAKSADVFMAKLDTAPKDGKVSWSEFVDNSRHFLPPALQDSKGRLDPSLIPHVFQEIAGADGESADQGKVADYVASKVTGAAALFAGAIGDASAKLALDALDADGDGKIRQKDLEDLVSDINAQLDAS